MSEVTPCPKFEELYQDAKKKSMDVQIALVGGNPPMLNIQLFKDNGLVDQELIKTTEHADKAALRLYKRAKKEKFI